MNKIKTQYINNNPGNKPIPGWLDSQINNKQRQQLRAGQNVYLQDIRDPNQTLVTGKFQLATKQQENYVRFLAKKEKLQIPNKIDGQELSSKDRQDLKNNKFVLLKNNLLIKVDTKLNRVLIQSQQDLKNVQYIGNHKLSPQEQKQLLNGEVLSLTLQNPKNGKWLTTSVSIDKSSKSLSFDINKTKTIPISKYPDFGINPDKPSLKPSLQDKDFDKLIIEAENGNHKALDAIHQKLKNGQHPNQNTIHALVKLPHTSENNAIRKTFDLDSKKSTALAQMLESKSLTINGKAQVISDIQIDLLKNTLAFSQTSPSGEAIPKSININQDFVQQQISNQAQSNIAVPKRSKNIQHGPSMT